MNEPSANPTEQSSPAAAPSAETSTPATLEDMWSALSNVVDPELHMNIVDLGLIYGIEQNGSEAKVEMTLTTPGCPYGPYLLHEIDAALTNLPGVDKADLNVVWDPPWGPDKMSEEVRLELGFDL